MKEKWNMGRAIFALIGGWVGWFFGGLDGLMYAMLVFILMDYITGVIAAAVKRELSSEVGAKGIAKKVGELILVGVGNVLDRQILQHGAAMRTLVIFFYVANEGLSILENLGRIGVPYPKQLKDFLKKLKEDNNKKKDDKKTEKKEDTDGKEKK
jgi:toxin secretion/phage lysis holin